MKLAVSNIAWDKEEEPQIAELLNNLDISYIEVAPTKEWEDPTQASEDKVEQYKALWQKQGLEIAAFQSMLFNRLDLKIFEDVKNRQETLTYLNDFIKLAGKMGATAMVFGSPKNRQRGEISYEKAFDIAKDFFGEIGEIALQQNVIFCIEPNPVQYNCDFVTNVQQGIDLGEA